MELHYKCTIWCKIKLGNEVNKTELIKKLQEGYLPLEVAYDGVVEGVSNAEWETINDTEQYLSLKENDYQSTIEVMEEDDKGILHCIWNNEIKKEE